MRVALSLCLVLLPWQGITARARAVPAQSSGAGLLEEQRAGCRWQEPRSEGMVRPDARLWLDETSHTGPDGSRQDFRGCNHIGQTVAEKLETPRFPPRGRGSPRGAAVCLAPGKAIQEALDLSPSSATQPGHLLWDPELSRPPRVSVAGPGDGHSCV